ncbi:MAG TPA: MFS transporter, partial [Oligoflexia bacterium]|nr:MFS transporter [Oligoflexia bacterium]
MSTAFPLRLTLEQARHSQRCFFIFALLNAFSFAALAESILMLFALKLGATAFEIGLLASYINLTMIFMFLGKFMVSRWGAAKTYGACWLSRNVAAALMIFAPYFYYEYSPSAGLTLLLASSFLFFVFRGMGVAAHNVLLNDITSEQSRGRFMGINSAGTNLVMLSTLIALSFYLKGEPSFLRFQIVVAWGCVMGIASSFAAFAVRESEGPRQSSREPLLWALSLVFQQKGIRRLVLAWIAATIGVQLLIPFQVLAVKKGYLLADAMVVRFVAVQMLGSMAAAYLNSLLLDRAGPRPVLIINVLALAMCSAVWALSPGAVNFVYTDVLFFIAGFCSLTVQICLQHYFLNIVRKQSVVNLSLVVSMLEGACAGLAGTFLGGGVLLLLPQYGLEGMEVYRVYFAGVAVLQLGAALLVRRLQPLVERRVPEVLGMMFSLRDWRAMLSVQRLAQTPELERVETLIDELAILQSNVSEQTLLEYLD